MPGFKQWEMLFDAELNNPDKTATRRAWRILVTDHHCDPHALKSLLLYAAFYLKEAQEASQAWAAFGKARETTLKKVAQLKKPLRELMLLSTPRGQVASELLFAWRVKKKDVSFSKAFPGCSNGLKAS
jgi:hypothetical protein